MGLLGLLSNVGHGIVGGIDNVAYNSLGGGLLGSALGPTMPTRGLLASPADQGETQAQYDDQGNVIPGAPAQPLQNTSPQPWQPTPEQRKNMRSQLLLSLSAALQQHRPIAEGIQNYQNNTIAQLQAGRAQDMAQQKQQAMQGFQQEMQAAAGDPAKQQAVLLKYGPIIGPQELGGYVNLLKEMKPPKPETDDVVGAPFARLVDGKTILSQHTKSGKIIDIPGGAPNKPVGQPVKGTDAQGKPVLLQPMEYGPPVPVSGYTPEKNFRNDGSNIYDSNTGEIIHTKPDKPEYEYIRTAQGIVRAQKNGGDGTATPVAGPGGQPLMPFAAPKEPKDETPALDREAFHYGAPWQKMADGAATQLEKISEAKSMINGPAAAQALGIPKVLTALVSGAGSGVRVTQAEMGSILHARGIEGDLEGFVNKVSGQGALTATQKAQLSAVLDDTAAKIAQKRAVATGTLDRINSSLSRSEITQHDKTGRDALYGPETPAQSNPVVDNILKRYGIK